MKIIKVYVLLSILILCVSCNKKEYNISFNYNNGLESTTIQTEKNYVKEPTNPEYLDYYFMGWYLNDEEFDFNSKITKDITLEAKWEKNIENIRIILDDDRYMDLELYRNIAPITVNNFLKLVDNGFYNGVCFHRIVKDFMIQAGGYYVIDKTIYQKETVETIKGEFSNNGISNSISHDVGVISMARIGGLNDSASGQFFICTKKSDFLDGDYAAFGRIINEESLQVLASLNDVQTTVIDRSLMNFPVDVIQIKTINRMS